MIELLLVVVEHILDIVVRILHCIHLVDIHQHCSLLVDTDCCTLVDHIEDILHNPDFDIERSFVVVHIDRNLLRIVDIVDQVEMIVRQAERNLRPVEMI